jgi:DNA polymerase (family 10)
MHSTESDGSASIEDMALEAAAAGLRYIAITDHSKALAMANGLDEARLRRQALAIARVNEGLQGKIRVLRGVEVDILRDGTLDLEPDLLRELDVVVASVHSSFGLPREEMTARVVRAIESGCVDVIGHPTGRVLLRREPFQIDVEAVLRAARARGVALELNAYPDRLDLSDVHCRRARELGVKVVISTDSHAPVHLKLLEYGVGNARRGWLEAKDVINTLDSDAFLRRLHEGHR